MQAAALESEAKDAHNTKAADKLHEFCMAVEAVADAELLQLGLPVLRLVLPSSVFFCELCCTCLDFGVSSAHPLLHVTHAGKICNLCWGVSNAY